MSRMTTLSGIEEELGVFGHSDEQVGPGLASGVAPGSGTLRILAPSAGNGCPCLLCGKFGCSCPKDPDEE